MTQISEVEAKLVLRRAAKLSQANSELEAGPKRFPGALVWMAPSLLMIPFGDALPKSLGISSQGTWALLGLFVCVLALGHEVYIQQRKIAALTEVMRSMQRPGV